jgi:hypothetical protein
MRLAFARYSLESINDFIEVYDKNGQIVDVVTGFARSGFSRPVQGDELKVVFRSNSRVTGWGFELEGDEVVE